eukprot:7565134-Lingulodinium_polyedra.AAC.1
MPGADVPAADLENVHIFTYNDVRGILGHARGVHRLGRRFPHVERIGADFSLAFAGELAEEDAGGPEGVGRRP